MFDGEKFQLKAPRWWVFVSITIVLQTFTHGTLTFNTRRFMIVLRHVIQLKPSSLFVYGGRNSCSVMVSPFA